MHTSNKRNSILAGLLAATAAAAAALPAAAGQSHAIVDLHCAQQDGLGSTQQLRMEKLVAEVLRSPEIAAGRERIVALYRQDAMAKIPDGAATIDHAALSIATAMAGLGVIHSSADSGLMWTANAGHRWFGIETTNSGYGIENPDNVYRHVAIDGAGRYTIKGRLPAQPPSQQSFILYDGIPGIGKMTKEGADVIAVLDQVQTDADGNFTITVDAEPAGGRVNHIRSRPGQQALIVRDSLADWARETPIPLQVSRLDAHPAGLASLPAAVRKTAELIETSPRYWLDYNNTYLYTQPPNRVSPPRLRPSGWGMSASGHFDLAAGQALVITLHDLGAGYLGFQLADTWGVALEYVERTGSLNAAQVKRNPDGSITYVIAAEDPGVHNWLDTGGLRQGIFAIRWQDFGATPNPGDAVVGYRLMPVKEIAETTNIQQRLSAAQRDQQRAQRKNDYLKRVGCR